MSGAMESLSTFIRDTIGYAGKLDPNLDLLDAQILDSFNIVELAMFVQEQFDVELEAEDLVRANLSTLASIVALIERRKAVDPS